VEPYICSLYRPSQHAQGQSLPFISVKNIVETFILNNTLSQLFTFMPLDVLKLSVLFPMALHCTHTFFLNTEETRTEL
jgi:hypothetical protein